MSEPETAVTPPRTLDVPAAEPSPVDALAQQLVLAVSGDPYWERCLAPFTRDTEPKYALHLGVFAEPFLAYMLGGLKTVESRFSTRRVSPYGRVGPGDVVLLKRVSGPIVGLARISDAWFYRLDPTSWDSIRRDYTAALCAQDPIFWEQRRSASFASLMRVEQVRSIDPLRFPKKDRRGWVVLRPGGPTRAELLQ